VLDGEVAVPCNPQPATAGLNSLLRSSFLGKAAGQVALKARSCAMKTCEPRQDRKVAAVNRKLHVPQGHLAGAGCPAGVRGARSGKGARPKP
jgi:hypothetical protein